MRSRACIWLFSSTQSTNARSGGFRYRPTMSSDLGLELRIVRDLELLDSMRLDLETLPHPVHHHARYMQVSGQGPNTPLRRVSRSALQRRVQNRLLHFRRPDSPRPLPGRSRYHSRHPAAFKRRPCGYDRGSRYAQFPRNRVIRHSTVSQQDNPAFLSHSLGRCPCSLQAFQALVSSPRRFLLPLLA